MGTAVMTTEFKKDVVTLFAGATDLIVGAVGGVPVADAVASLWKAKKTTWNALFERKVTTFWEEFQNPEIDKVLLAQVYSNFRKEHGGNYFDEALFNVIEKSDSVVRTKMISRLIILCSIGEIPEEHFWEVLQVLQSLIMSDLEKLPRLLIVQRSSDDAVKKGFVDPEGARELDSIRNSVYQRFEAVGLVSRLPDHPMQIRQGRYRLDDTFVGNVCKCLNSP